MMRKTKMITIALLSILAVLFASSYVFAANPMENAANGVKGAVGGAENVVENAAGAVGGAIKSTVDNAGKGLQRTGDAVHNTTRNAGTVENTTGNDGYRATRTATDGGTLMGMNSTFWTWAVIVIVAAAIAILVWSYMKQGNRHSDNYNDR